MINPFLPRLDAAQWRDMLKQYMRHVGGHEGSYLLASEDWTPDEFALLNVLAHEIEAERTTP